MARILLVDDDSAVLEALRRVLTRMGHGVSLAREGGEAFRIYAREPTDIVLTDLIMPGTEGVELIQQLRRQYQGVKIIAMSGGGRIDPRDLLKLARHLGADRVLAKPFEDTELAAAIEALLPGTGDA